MRERALHAGASLGELHPARRRRDAPSRIPCTAFTASLRAAPPPAAACHCHHCPRLRTQHELWRQPHGDVAATADCYAFTRGPQVLVVLTNAGSSRLEHGGSNSGGSKAGQRQCSVVLPEGFSMLRGGLGGVRDVLQGGQVRAAFEAQSRAAAEASACRALPA